MESQPTSSPAVAVKSVSKAFQLPHERVSTLKERVLHPFSRRTFDGLQALDEVSLEVAPGEFFGIVGPNGSGKSTLMKCLAGIYRADAGEMWVRGRLAPFIELGVGFNPDLTARDNVKINAIMLGLSPTQASERYDAIVEFAELERFVDLKLKNYSSGMHVRLAFAVMIHVDADILLIDEVLAVGDAGFQRKCQDALLAARDEGTTILLVTHDMNAVQRFCHRAMLLYHGRVEAIGEPNQIARRYEATLLGGPAGDRAALTQLGDGGAAIVDVWIEDEDGVRSTTFNHGRTCSVAMLVELREDVEDPRFGVVVSDERHRPVFAATSAWRGESSGSFRAGDRVQVRVSFDNLLAEGRYFVSPEVARGGTGRHLMDHRAEAAVLSVVGSREGAGIVDLPHEFTIQRTAAVEAGGGR